MYISCMHKTTIYLDYDVYQHIRRLAEADGRTQASVIRDALVQYVAGGARRPRSVGLGRSGVGNLSERSEELLRGMGQDS